MRLNWMPFRPSVLVLYKWFTAISRLQVTLGPPKTVQQHRWTVVRIRLCSILLKELVLKKHFQVIVIHDCCAEKTLSGNCYTLLLC